MTPYVITQADADAGVVTNTAQAQAQAPCPAAVGDGAVAVAADCGPVSSTPATASLQVSGGGAGTSGISLAKSAQVVDDGDGRTDPGDRIRWTLTLTNTGTTPIRGLAVSDPTAGAVSCPVVTLAPGARTTCTTADHLITGTDARKGSVSNTATATAYDATGRQLSDSATARVSVSLVPGLANTGATSGLLAALVAGLLLVAAGSILTIRRRISRKG